MNFTMRKWATDEFKEKTGIKPKQTIQRGMKEIRYIPKHARLAMRYRTGRF